MAHRGRPRDLLLAYGLPLVPEHVAADADEAVAAAGELGFPVVVKTAQPGAHKTEQEGSPSTFATLRPCVPPLSGSAVP